MAIDLVVTDISFHADWNLSGLLKLKFQNLKKLKTRFKHFSYIILLDKSLR